MEHRSQMEQSPLEPSQQQQWQVQGELTNLSDDYPRPQAPTLPQTAGNIGLYAFTSLFSLLYLIIILSIAYFIAINYRAHRLERTHHNRRHIYPLSFNKSTEFFILQDPVNHGLLNVYQKGNHHVSYLFARDDTPMLRRWFSEQWKLADNTGFELARIYYRGSPWPYACVNFLLSRQQEEVHSTVRITPVKSNMLTTLPLKTVQDGLGSNNFQQHDTVRSKEVIREGATSAASAALSSVLSGGTKRGDISSTLTLCQDSSLINNALISPEQVGTKIPFEPLSLLNELSKAQRESHHVDVSLFKYFKIVTFKLVKDDKCWLKWNPVGYLDMTTITEQFGPICEEVGFISKDVPMHHSGYKLLLNTSRVDPISGLTTSFILQRNKRHFENV